MGNFLTEIEGRGRIVIPKAIRQEFKIRPGQKLLIEKRDKEIVLRLTADAASLIELKGCVTKSKLKPLDLKNIWK